MQNNNYNSLEEKLIQSGILQNANEPVKTHVDAPLRENFFESKKEEIEPQQDIKISKKRLNNYDLDLLEKAEGHFTLDSENKFLQIFYKFFPAIYRIKIAKDISKELSLLDIDTNTLMNKTVPYGENEIRYKNIIKYLKYANKIQSKIKKK